ncbi:MAG: SUMF1/EgtB/PvdO family nonheme iron enzyme [bacterium]
MRIKQNLLICFLWMYSLHGLLAQTSTLKKAGDKITFKANEVIFNMIYVPGKQTFPIGVDDKKKATVDKSYLIGETEVTYELWYKIRVWAEQHGYSFAYKGKEGSAGKPGSALTVYKNNPVTGISWRDTIIWSNALTEWFNSINKTKYTCVYYEDSNFKKPIRHVNRNNSISIQKGSQDDPYENLNANGFRLLKSNEWELAARYKDGKDWTPGNYISGTDIEFLNDFLYINGSFVSETILNDTVAWYKNEQTSDVKKLQANKLGVYDMSGNVWEWCFDKYPDTIHLNRIMRGGSCFYYVLGLRVGHVYWNAPYGASYDLGFRLAMTDSK